MKKILCLCMAVIIAFNFSAFAGDFEEHWAKEDILKLIASGIVSGDDNGNINPESPIKKGEFVKIINKIAGFSEAGEDGFADVEESKWYYRDFLIARKAGYIEGDEHGLAHPEAIVNREQAAKIIACALKLDVSGEPDFYDSENISSWARGAVASLVGKGIIRGYEGNVFLPKNQLKRGEAFHIAASLNIEGKEEKNETSPVSLPGGNITAAPSGGASSGRGSSGGGSGGSSGGGVNTRPLNPPVIIKIDTETNEIFWKKVSGATGYELNIYTNGDKEQIEIPSSKTEYQLGDIFTKFCENAEGGLSSIDAFISMRAIRNGEYSEYTNEEKVVLEINKFLSNADLEMSVKYEKDGTGGYAFFLYWNSDSADKVIIKDGSGNHIDENIKCPHNINKYITDFSYSYNVILSKGKDVQSISFTGEFAYFGGGDGSEENPYLISEGYQFANISKKSGSYFLQTEDITLESGFIPVSVDAEKPFSGHYDGNGKIITANIEREGEFTSLFGEINGAEIKNIAVDGKFIADGRYAGAIAGKAADSVITDCVSDADITVNGLTLQNGADAGGIVGYISGESELSNCEMRGNISSTAGFTGGICGRSLTAISGCKTSGSVIVTNESGLLSDPSCVGGIAGYSTGKISGCEVDSLVESQYAEWINNHKNGNTFIAGIYMGGIVGYINNAEINNCRFGENGVYRVDLKGITPINSSAVYGGGICGFSRLAASKINSCVNEGRINCDYVASSTCWIGGIAGYAAGNVSECLCDAVIDSVPIYGGIAARTAAVTVDKCMNTSSYLLNGIAGGIIGRSDNGTITNCINIGSFPRKNGCGLFATSSATIRSSYSCPPQTGNYGAITTSGTISAASDLYYVPTGAEVSLSEGKAEGKTYNELIEIFKELDDSVWQVLEVDETNKFPLPQLISLPYYKEFIIN